MKEQELLFLGLLNDGPKHGYQLKKLMREVSSTFAGFKTDSTYYPLKKMLKNGLVTLVAGKEGRRPKKYIYTITPRGEEEFKKLLSKNIQHIERPYFSLDLSLYFLKHIPGDLKKRYLRIRLKLLNKLKKDIRELRKTFDRQSALHLITILDHNLELLFAEIKFITRLIKES